MKIVSKLINNKISNTFTFDIGYKFGLGEYCEPRHLPYSRPYTKDEIDGRSYEQYSYVTNNRLKNTYDFVYDRENNMYDNWRKLLLKLIK